MQGAVASGFGILNYALDAQRFLQPRHATHKGHILPQLQELFIRPLCLLSENTVFLNRHRNRGKAMVKSLVRLVTAVYRTRSLQVDYFKCSVCNGHFYILRYIVSKL
jgi:hypothetical protein